MESTPYQRLEEFWLLKGLKNASAFAEAIKRPPGTVSALKTRGSAPGNKLMQAIQQVFPDLNPDYILWGSGTMLRENKELKPFFPAGEVNSQGHTKMPTGGIAATGFSLGDTEPNNELPITPAPDVVKTHQDFIKKLLREADELRDTVKELQSELKSERARHLGIIEELQSSNRFLQAELSEARAELRGKETGNQYDAPGDLTIAAEPRPQVKGLWRGDDKPTPTSECIVRCITSAPAPTDVLHGSSTANAA